MSAAPDKGRVLIVDDEPGVLRAAERVLASSLDVATASSPSQAIALAPEFKPDLVVCDIRMPQMDGFALVDALRERSPDIDVIFMTGSHSDPDAHLVRAMRERAFFFVEKPFDRQVLETLVERCLELRRLRQDQRRHTRRLEQELEEARLFQQTMLGPAECTIAGVEVAAHCRPSGRLGGDLFDCMPVGDSAAAFIIADVRGHGASAAMLTAVVKSAFRAAFRAGAAGFDPLRVVSLLRASLLPFGADRFVTLICGCVDSSARTLTYVNAGHPPGLLVSGAKSRDLAPTAPLISSVFDDGAYAGATVTLAPGDGLLLYTDGLAEALRLRTAEFRSWLDETCRRDTASARAMLAAVWSRVTSGGADDAADDITVMALRPG